MKKRIESQGAAFVVLRLKRVRNPDVVCVERIEHFLREQETRGVTVLLAGVRPDTLRALQNVGFESWFPASQTFPEEDRDFSATLGAVRYVYAKLRESDAGSADSGAHFNMPAQLYYLV